MHPQNGLSYGLARSYVNEHRSTTIYDEMRGPIALAMAMLVGCSSQPTKVDVCDLERAGEAGSVELGRDRDYAPVIDGETLQVELGLQGLWMFIVNARAFDMDIVPGETAAVWFYAVSQAGETISLDLGCRDREFKATEGGVEMTDPYQLALRPEYSHLLAGGTLTLEVIIRDPSGMEATTTRTIIASMPMPM